VTAADEKMKSSMKTLKGVFEERFGDLSDGPVFKHKIERGNRRIRRGIPAIAFLAAALDPRTKALEYLQPEDRANIWSTIRNVMIEHYKQDLQDKSRFQEGGAANCPETNSKEHEHRTRQQHPAGGGEDFFSMLNVFKVIMTYVTNK
jgi:hypothetical protein